ncbi:MAG: methyltransferase [Sedimentisphaerales bacterium]|nr:methyltransferase [Sedimentisphaerales bacterium]
MEGAIVFEPDHPFDAKALKKTLEDAGYSQTALAETLGISSPSERQDPEVVYRRVRAESPYHVLVRLFWLGRTVSESTVRKTLPGLDVPGLEAAGLLERRDGLLRSHVILAPYYELLLASDFGPEIKGPLAADHVLGVGAASVTLANLTVRREVGSALDLGCGAGIQAFLAARHARRVVGTDTNARALNFAAFNARVNAIDRVEWRQGSLYEPVDGEQFDLIVANPPFVISPESRFVFRDSTMAGDAISQQVIAGAGARLTEGGFACVLFNWHHRDDGDWDSRPRSWVRDTGCDALVVRFKSTDPLVYAADWLRTTVGRDCPDYGRHLDEWMAYYEDMGIERISAGAIIMRRRSGSARWFRSHAIGAGSYTGFCGAQIERIFATEDLLPTLDDAALLEQRLVLDQDHVLQQQLKVEGGRWGICSQRLSASVGLPFAGNVDSFIASLLAGCDGRRRLRELVLEVAGRMQTDAETITADCLAVVRKLMQSGFLRAADDVVEGPGPESS